MFGTKTLAEIKNQLIDELGYLPDFSDEPATPRRDAPQVDLNELEKSLNKALDELECDLKKLQDLNCRPNDQWC